MNNESSLDLSFKFHFTVSPSGEASSTLWISFNPTGLSESEIILIAQRLLDGTVVLPQSTQVIYRENAT